MKSLEMLPKEVRDALQARVDETSQQNVRDEEMVKDLLDKGEMGVDEKEFNLVGFVDGRHERFLENLNKTIADPTSSKELVARTKIVKKNYESVVNCKFFGKELVKECKVSFNPTNYINAKSKALAKMNNSKIHHFHDPAGITENMARCMAFTEQEHDLLMYVFYTYVNSHSFQDTVTFINEFIQMSSILNVLPLTSESVVVNTFKDSIKSITKLPRARK